MRTWRKWFRILSGAVGAAAPERVTELMKRGAKQMAGVVKAAGIQPE